MSVNSIKINGDLSEIVDRAYADEYAQLHGKKISERANRLTTFLTDADTKIFYPTVSPIIKGTVVGATTIGVTGAIVGGPKGLAIGAGAGAGAGFVGGCIYSAIQHKKSYTSWLNQHRGDETFKEILSIYQQEEFKEKFTCAITHEPVVNPVISPNGRIYEKSAIEQWLNSGETDPFTRQPLKIKDLRKDFTTLGKQCKALNNYLSVNSENKMSPFARKALEKLKAQLEKQAETIFQQEMKALNDLLVAKKITRSDFTRQMVKLQAILDGEEIED